MADHSQNISNVVRCFGGGPTTKWGQSFGVPYTMTWGTAVWGEDNSLPYSFEKVINNSVSSDGVIVVQQVFFSVLSISVSPMSDMVTEQLMSGDWYYVFPGGVTDSEDQHSPSWSADSDESTSFTCQAVGSTSWS